MGWLAQQKRVVSRFWGWEVWDSGVSRVDSFWELTRDRPLRFWGLAGGLWHCVTPRSSSQMLAFTVAWTSPMEVPLSNFSFYPHISSVGLEVHPNPVWLILMIYLLWFSCSVMSHSLRPQGLQPTRLPCPLALPEFAQTHVHWWYMQPPNCSVREILPFWGAGRQQLGGRATVQSTAWEDEHVSRLTLWRVTWVSVLVRGAEVGEGTLLGESLWVCGGCHLGRTKLRVWCFLQESASKMGDLPCGPWAHYLLFRLIFCHQWQTGFF